MSTIYSDTTPAVSYSYDTGANGIGQLTGVTSNGFSTSYTSFDVMGHVTASSQTTSSQTYTFSNYTYKAPHRDKRKIYPLRKKAPNMACKSLISHFEDLERHLLRKLATPNPCCDKSDRIN